MVYYGKLSKGCERCRLRKVRCDQSKPGCKRCEKSSTTCPGYRDLSQVLFRDESARIVKMARRDAHAIGNLDVAQQQLASAMQRVETALVSSGSSVPRSLQPSLGQMAAGFFFSNFGVEGPLLSSTNGDFLISICQDHSESAASHAIEAVGLAGLSNISGAHHLRVEAQKRYGQALAKTNHSLSDPAKATSDITAMSVLLLGQFEAMTVESWDQYGRLSAHVKGASALLKLRGQEQFERESGIHLYFAIRLQIVSAFPHQLPFAPILLTFDFDSQMTYCMQKELPVPDILLESARALKNSPVERPRNSKVSMGDIFLRYINFIASMRTKWSLENVDIQWLQKEVDGLDRALQEWRLGIYPDYEYTTVNVAAVADDICNLPVTYSTKEKRHVYKTRLSVYVWNKWRIISMLIYRLRLDYGISHTRDLCENDLRDLSTDICLSVPTLLATGRKCSVLTLFTPTSPSHTC